MYGNDTHLEAVLMWIHFPLLALESSDWSVTLLDASVTVTECSSREMAVTVGEENTCCKGIYLILSSVRWSDH